MERILYDCYGDNYLEGITTGGLQNVGQLMQSIDNHSYSVPRRYETINQTLEV
ncbi:hypothetical protein [Methanogenium cariaci]|jgi:hypothetical protein|uniref:hypothetical protein n=1 Tax=Methanogenium cariaci TaxID=2197 RepID=UPI0012F6BE64|nr:hypothetical protein [Methanogenium cariaci]